MNLWLVQFPEEIQWRQFQWPANTCTTAWRQHPRERKKTLNEKLKLHHGIGWVLLQNIPVITQYSTEWCEIETVSHLQDFWASVWDEGVCQAFKEKITLLNLSSVKMKLMFSRLVFGFLFRPPDFKVAYYYLVVGIFLMLEAK